MLKKRHNGSIYRADSQQAVKSPPLLVRSGIATPPNNQPLSCNVLVCLMLPTVILICLILTVLLSVVAGLS